MLADAGPSVRQVVAVTVEQMPSQHRHSMGGGSLGRKWDVVKMQHIEFDHLLYSCSKIIWTLSHNGKYLNVIALHLSTCMVATQ